MRPPIIHRDLKTPNIFLTAPLPLVPLECCSCSSSSALTSPPCTTCSSFLSWNDLPVAKVGDFGLSTQLVGLNELQVASPSLAISQDGGLSCINPTWAAPEILAGEPYSLQSDVYGFGLLMWELLTREAPFQEVDIFYRKEVVKKGGRPEVPGWVREGAVGRGYVALMERCWDGDPGKRPKMGEVYESLRGFLGMVGPELVGMFPERGGGGEDEGELSSMSSSPYSVPLRGAECVVGPLLIESPNPFSFCLMGEKKEELGESVFASGHPGKATMRVCSMTTSLGKFIWVGFKNGRVGVFNGEGGQVKFVYCVEEHCHVQAVNALLWDSCRGLVWSGSEDGGLKVDPFSLDFFFFYIFSSSPFFSFSLLGMDLFSH